MFADNGCRSWYKTEDGVVVSNQPGTALQYLRELSTLHWDDYDLVGCEDTTILPKGAQGLGGTLEKSPSSALTFLTWLTSMAYRNLGQLKGAFKAVKHR